MIIAGDISRGRVLPAVCVSRLNKVCDSGPGLFPIILYQEPYYYMEKFLNIFHK